VHGGHWPVVVCLSVCVYGGEILCARWTLASCCLFVRLCAWWRDSVCTVDTGQLLSVCLCGGDSVCTVDTGQLLSVCMCGGEILCARWTLVSCCLCGCFATFYAYPGICCHYVCKRESTRWNIYLSVIMTFISLITVQ